MTIRKPSRKKDREDMSAEERAQADLTDIRCLMLCIAMLERVNGVSYCCSFYLSLLHFFFFFPFFFFCLWVKLMIISPFADFRRQLYARRNLGRLDHPIREEEGARHAREGIGQPGPLLLNRQGEMSPQAGLCSSFPLIFFLSFLFVSCRTWH